MRGHEDPRWGTSTRCVHAGKDRLEDAGSSTPIDRSATFRLDDASYAAIAEGRMRDVRIYTRYGNPTVDSLRRRLAALEGADDALCFASGMAAMHAALVSSLPRGGRVLASADLYGGNVDLLERGLPELGFEVERADFSDRDAFDEALTREPDVVFCESLSNPLLRVCDLPRVSARAHAAGATVIVDATFTTPLLSRPLEQGADLVCHSASKYIGGHSDVIAGVVCGDARRIDALKTELIRFGGCIDPQPAWLLERGLKTLALRMRAHCDGALHVARALEAHPRIARVFHPGLPSHPDHELAGELLSGFGGIVSFEVQGGDASALRVIRGLSLALEAPSLGGVETLATLPCTTSHAALTPDARLAAGIHPGLVRLAVGIEDPDDLVNDLRAALDRLG